MRFESLKCFISRAAQDNMEINLNHPQVHGGRVHLESGELFKRSSAEGLHDGSSSSRGDQHAGIV